MGISEFSVIMSIACSSLIFFAAGMLVSHAKRVRWGFILLILAFGFVRLILPLEIYIAKVIPVWKAYPEIHIWIHRKWVGNWTLAELLLFIWGVGICVFLLSLLSDIKGIKEISQRSALVMERDLLYQICEQAKAELGYSKPVRLAVTGELDTAVSIGFLSPDILIPKEMLNFSEPELKGVLKHELTHYLCGDVGKQRVIILLQIIFWWNPVLHYLRKCVEGMLELECDERACRGMDEETRKAYLRAITKVLRADEKSQSKVGLGWRKKFSDSFLHRRFQEVLQPVERQSNTVTYILAFLCLVLFCLSYSIVVQPGIMPEEAKGSSIRNEEFWECNVYEEFLIKLPDGTYQYVADMLERKILTEDDIKKAPYADLPIYYNTGKGE
jgi:beta-lactamase regulating signal transducer with metallopeptidase domain